MSSYQPSAEMPLITHGSFREISIAQLSGDYLPLSLVLEQVIKISKYSLFSLLPINPAFQEFGDPVASTGIVLTLFCDIIQQ